MVHSGTEGNWMRWGTYLVAEVLNFIFWNRLVVVQLLDLAIQNSNLTVAQKGCHSVWSLYVLGDSR